MEEECNNPLIKNKLSQFETLSISRLQPQTPHSLQLELNDNNSIVTSSVIDPVSRYIDETDNLSALWSICIVLGLGNMADAIEITCVGFILSDIDNISINEQEFLTSAVFVGMLLGGIVCGCVSDVVGRRPVLLISLALNCIAGVFSAFSWNISSLIWFRVIGGLGIGGSVPIVFSLGAEIFPTKSRGGMLSVIASFWMIGTIYTAGKSSSDTMKMQHSYHSEWMSGFAWIVLGKDFNGNVIYKDGNWRLYALICAIPVLLTFLATYIIMPESPRFLTNKRRFKDAAKHLEYICLMSISESELRSQYHRYNHVDNDSDGDSDKVNENDKNTTFNNEYNDNNTVSAVSHEQPQPLYDSIFLCCRSVTKLFHKSLLRRTIAVGVIWYSLSFGSYGISTWIVVLFNHIGLTNAYADSFIFALATLPGNIISICFIDRIGRRMLLFLGLVFASISSLIFAFDLDSAVVVVSAAALFNAFSVMAWNSLDCIAVEIFPTKLRTTAMGLLASTGRIGAVMAQFVNGSLQSNVMYLLIVTSGCMLIGGFATCLLDKDTTGQLVVDEDINLHRDQRKNINFERQQN